MSITGKKVVRVCSKKSRRQALKDGASREAAVEAAKKAGKEAAARAIKSGTSKRQAKKVAERVTQQVTKEGRRNVALDAMKKNNRIYLHKQVEHL